MHMCLNGVCTPVSVCIYLSLRCWTYETSLLVNQTIDEELPPTQFYEYFAPDYLINVVPSREVERDNHNKKEVGVPLVPMPLQLVAGYPCLWSVLRA